VPPAVAIAAAKIEEKAMVDRTAGTLHALGIAQLVLGRTDTAVAALEEASRLAPAKASVWADLSAAYYERSGTPDGALNLPKGLQAANTAITLGGVDGPAWFNKALLLERLHTRDQAIAAWKRFLETDGDSPWAREARQRLADLENSGALRLPGDTQGPRDALMDDVLGRWGDAITRRDTASAAKALSDARRLAVSLAPVLADRFAMDVVEHVASAHGTALLFAAEGHAAYRAARTLYKREDFDAAAPLFEQAARQFALSFSPAAYTARLYSGIIRYRRNDLAGAIATLVAVGTETEGRGYTSIAGRAVWVRGLALEVSGSARQASDCYAKAVRLLATAGESSNAAFVEGLRASQLDRLGNADAAWNAWAMALEDTAREGTLLTAAISASRLGWPRAALDLQNAATDVARRAGRLTSLADALRWQAVTYAQLGQLSDTRKRIDEARAIADGRPGAAWERIRAEIDLADANAEGASAPDVRIASATRALAYFRSANAVARLPETLLARATANMSAGDLDAAYTDAREGARILGSLREQVSPGADQMRFADVVRLLVATVVEVQDSRGRLREAFDVVEDARARDLPDAATPLTLAELEHFVPPQTVLAMFVVGRDRSYVWVVRQGRSTAVRIAAGRDVVARLAANAGPPRFEREAALALRRLAIDPVVEGGGSDDLLVIVPDGPLHAIAFAALPGKHSTYLIEEHPIVLSPSARGWLFASRRLSTRDKKISRAFVAGNARTDTERFGSLPDLPSANAEASAVAKLYGTTAVTDAAVTGRTVLGGFDADVVHFAGHAVVNDQQPSLSALVVWDPDGAGLSADVIRAQTLSSTRLVVLASCRSSSGAPTHAEGSISLARAFLAAGALNVVASNWMVEDRGSKELMVRFHEAYLANGDAARALRSAQMMLARSSDIALRSPKIWAGFAVFGATAVVSQLGPPSQGGR
jgi:CHAT domain-containing protein/tetratricopeptide (TPR) repeat protein